MARDRSTSAEKSICPGVSTNWNKMFSQEKFTEEAFIEIPLLFSIAKASVMADPLSTLPRDMVAPGLQNRFRRPPSTCSTLVRSGHHAGAVGMDGGGQVVQKQLIGGSATSTVWPAVSQSFAAGRRGSTGCAQLKLAICFPTEVGKQMARSLS